MIRALLLLMLGWLGLAEILPMVSSPVIISQFPSLPTTFSSGNPTVDYNWVLVQAAMPEAAKYVRSLGSLPFDDFAYGRYDFTRRRIRLNVSYMALNETANFDKAVLNTLIHEVTHAFNWKGSPVPLIDLSVDQELATLSESVWLPSFNCRRNIHEQFVCISCRSCVSGAQYNPLGH